MPYQPSIVTFEQPIKRINIIDWHGKLVNQNNIATAQRSDSFDIRQNARTLRNEVDIKTAWDAAKNTSNLTDRITELRNWRELLETTVQTIEDDVNCLKNEKSLTEHDIRVLEDHLNVLNECFTIRDLRRKPEATHDDVEVQLKQELTKIEELKKLLLDHCDSCYEQITRLTEIKCQLILDIKDKTVAIQVDEEVCSLNRDRGDISYKPDVLEAIKHSTTYEVWLQQSRHLKYAADVIIAETPKVRESMYMARELAKNEALAFREVTDFTLRKRIYDSERAKNELEWQKRKTEEEMFSLMREIERLEENFNEKIKDLKCAETRLYTRMYRPGLEKAYDKTEISLNMEITDLRKSRQELDEKIRKSKAKHNALEDMKWKLDKDFDNKNHSLMTDIRCLDVHLRIKSPVADTQMKRNIQLTQMDKQMSSE